MARRRKNYLAYALIAGMELFMLLFLNFSFGFSLKPGRISLADATYSGFYPSASYCRILEKTSTYIIFRAEYYTPPYGAVYEVYFWIDKQIFLTTQIEYIYFKMNSSDYEIRFHLRDANDNLVLSFIVTENNATKVTPTKVLETYKTYKIEVQVITYDDGTFKLEYEIQLEVKGLQFSLDVTSIYYIACILANAYMIYKMLED